MSIMGTERVIVCSYQYCGLTYVNDDESFTIILKAKGNYLHTRCATYLLKMFDCWCLFEIDVTAKTDIDRLRLKLSHKHFSVAAAMRNN